MFSIFLFKLHPPHHEIENPFQWVKVEQLKVLAGAHRSEMGFDAIFGGGVQQVHLLLKYKLIVSTDLWA